MNETLNETRKVQWGSTIYPGKWVPVLIALGSFAVLVGLCVFIHKACCGRSQSVGVVLQGPNPGVTVVHSGNTMQQQPGYPSNTMQQPGYPMQQAPNYPA
uniref:Uncharacterized protein n=1 Tax=Magallana gigas TaxID=29159 RepID=K1QZK3_MAGGI